LATSGSAGGVGSVEARVRWTRRLLVLAGLALAGIFGLASPASAHGQFVTSDPERGSTITTPLTSVVLYFTEKPTSNAFFSVTAPSGTRVDRLWSHGTNKPLSKPVAEYYHNPNGDWEIRNYSIAYSAIVPVAYWPETGEYTISFVSVATDGEPVRGEVKFTYSGAITTPPADYHPQKNEPDPNLVAVARTDLPTAPPSARPAGEQQSANAASGPGVWIVLVPLGIVLLIAVGILIWRWPALVRRALVARFGGRYAPPPAPRKPIKLPAIPSLRRPSPGPSSAARPAAPGEAKPTSTDEP
jgi:methionine-rich copper-binding protein CopC